MTYSVPRGCDTSCHKDDTDAARAAVAAYADELGRTLEDYDA